MPPENADTSHVGLVLEDAYRLVRPIGVGGMSSLYESVHLKLNRRVVVKLLFKDLTKDPEALARFRREAEVTSGLGHPHIVHVSDFGTAPTGEPFLVMEFLEGEDLEKRLRMVPRLGLPDTYRIVKQVAAALTAAHGKGIVHRDLKPANIFLVNADGDPDFVKVLDFGISKVHSAVNRLTKGNAVMGTPYYMSPEQATGHSGDVDHRTDQWSLAAITWQLLTGQCPFQGDDANQLLYQVVFGAPPPLAALAPELGPKVEAVLLRAMSKNREDRYSSVREYADALKTAALAMSSTASSQDLLSSDERFSNGVPTSLLNSGPLSFDDERYQATHIPPRRSLWRRHRSLVAIAVAFLVIGVGGALLLAGLVGRPAPAPLVETPAPSAPR